MICQEMLAISTQCPAGDAHTERVNHIVEIVPFSKQPLAKGFTLPSVNDDRQRHAAIELMDYCLEMLSLLA